MADCLALKTGLAPTVSNLIITKFAHPFVFDETSEDLARLGIALESIPSFDPDLAANLFDPFYITGQTAKRAQSF